MITSFRIDFIENFELSLHPFNLKSPQLRLWILLLQIIQFVIGFLLLFNTLLQIFQLCFQLFHRWFFDINLDIRALLSEHGGAPSFSTVFRRLTHAKNEGCIASTIEYGVKNLRDLSIFPWYTGWNLLSTSDRFLQLRYFSYYSLEL